MGGAAARAAGEVDGATAASFPCRRARPRPCHARRTRDRTRAARSWRLRVKTIANLGALSLDFRLLGADLSLCAAALRPYDIPAIYCGVDAVYTNTAPVDAYAARAGRKPTFVVERLVEVRRANSVMDRAEFRRRKLCQRIPASDARDHDLRCRRATAPLNSALELADYEGFGRRAGAIESARKASCAASAFRLHRGLRASRPPAVARLGAAWACGNRRKCASIQRARWVLTGV